MTDHYSEYGLHLNGAWYSSEDLLKYCHEILNNGQSQDGELNIAKFIMDWCNPRDFIEVQTSGSTGQPQILSIKKEFAVNSALSTLDFLGLKPGDTALLCLPANFIAGKMMIIRSIIGKLKLISVEPKGNVYDDVSENIDFAAMIPLQVQNLLESPSGLSKLKQIRKLIIGGAAIPPVLEENLRTQNHPVYSTYGMTETISHIAMRRIDGAGYSRYYQLLPNISIDKDKDDCLIVNAPFLSENIVHTKDVVRISQNNEFEILGRLDNMIISGGIKYFPEILERKLAKCFKDRFIISSKPDPKLGEKIIIIIETGHPEKYPIQVVKSMLYGRLTEYEFPREVFFVKNFPETGTSKLARKQITMEVINRKIINP
jgi:O-succinylbenzoic acid--CoA ligase